MISEITSAINLLAYLLNLSKKIKTNKLAKFKKILTKLMSTLYKGHWEADRPAKYAVFRRIDVSHRKIDPLLLLAVSRSNISLINVQKLVKLSIIIHVDPDEVSFSSGANHIGIIYSRALGSTLPWEGAKEQPAHYNIGAFQKLVMILNKKIKRENKHKANENLALEFDRLSI
jgi:hypothetical protein